MSYILSESLLTVCEVNEDFQEYSHDIAVIKEHSQLEMNLFKFTVQARNWKQLSETERFIKVLIPAITDSIVKQGLVILYLNESGKTVSLPFTYYQAKRPIAFQPSYEKEFAYVNVLGNFILNPHASYTFRVLVLSNKILKKFKRMNWYNFDNVYRIINRKTK